MPDGQHVADAAKRYSEQGTSWGVGMCLKFSRTCAGAPAGTYDAIAAWRAARYRHSAGTPPRGALVFWEGGSVGHGHVAVSDGAGYVWSTDILRPARVDRISIAGLGVRWRNLRLLGWTEDVNGVRVSGLLPDPWVAVHLAQLRPGERGDEVRQLQLALRRAGLAYLNPSGATGYYGDETRAMCQAFQARQGWAGADADGVPGPDRGPARPARPVVDGAAWSAGAAVVASVLTWTVARRTADASLGTAWAEYLKPLREDLAALRGEVRELTAQNATLTAKLKGAEAELAWLRSMERATALRSTAEGAAVRTSLAGAGITVPELPVPQPRLERTRVTDYATQSDADHAE